MQLAKIDEEFILKHTQNIGIKSIKDILILTINNTGKIYVQPYNDSFSTIETNHSGGEW